MIIYKADFIKELSARLAPLPPEEREKSLTYWSELIDDRIEDGMSEERAVAGLGDVGEIARQIILETPMASLVKTKVRERKMGAFWLVLLVLGFPLWFPLLITAAVVVLSVYIALWSVSVALWSAVAGLGIGTIGGLAAAVFSVFTGGIGRTLACFGGALVCGGLAVLMFFASLAFSKLLIKCTVMLWRALKIGVAGNKNK
jgi:uncharacterized membrane protein